MTHVERWSFLIIEVSPKQKVYNVGNFIIYCFDNYYFAIFYRIICYFIISVLLAHLEQVSTECRE